MLKTCQHNSHCKNVRLCIFVLNTEKVIAASRQVITHDNSFHSKNKEESQKRFFKKGFIENKVLYSMPWQRTEGQLWKFIL